MRDAIIGIIVGVVVGVVVGATVIAPRLHPRGGGPTAAGGPASSVAAPIPAATTLSGRQVRWTMGSAYAPSLPLAGTLAKRVESGIWRVSAGGMELRYHEPGTLAPTADLFDAVATGAIDAAFASPGLWIDKVPALQLFAAVPFGPPPDEYLAWMDIGGGKRLFEKLYHKHGLHSVICGIMAPVASAWLRQEVRTVDDLEGLRMRFDGLGARVMGRLGVETVALPDDQVLMALEAGDIAAAQYATPAIDRAVGLQQFAKHYYFPGWHQPVTVFDLIINRDRWNALSATRKAQIETVCGDNVRHGLAESEGLQFAALRALTADGVQVHRWPVEILDALAKAWQQVVREQAAADSAFREVWTSLSAFRRDYAVWSELARP